MTKKTKLYILPGQGEKKSDYAWLMSRAVRRYDVVFLNLKLKNASFRELTKIKLDAESTVLGFSIGALVAYKLTTRVKKAVYCSIANALGTDIRNAQNEMIRCYGKKTVAELNRMHYGKPKAKCFVIFCGDKEITSRDKKMQAIFPVRIIRNTGHKITKNYKQAILKELGLSAVPRYTTQNAPTAHADGAVRR